jgi:HD-GYP domain-containing protein (c-di-GMP phosphodiesterase class II)
MRFVTRTFLLSFLPFALLLTGSFWAIQRLAVSSVREELRSSLRRTQISMARMQSKSELQNSRFLKVIGDNAPLKAGLQLMLSDPKSDDARRTVEDQLRELCKALGFDFLLASNAENRPMAGVMRVGEQLVAMDIARIRPPQRGFYTVGGLTYQVASVEVDQGDENLGILSVGERFEFSEFSTPAVLTRNGKVVKSSVPGIPLADLESALQGCRRQSECEIRLAGQTYLSLPVESIYFGDGYLLRSLQNVDSATAPVQSILRNVFVVAGLGALLAALVLSVVSSRSIVQPIAVVIAKLREGARTSVLPEFSTTVTAIHEIRELMESFNRAAAVIRDGEENLHRAYVEFVESLANALDARDGYTAGHSRRVSEGSCAVAAALDVTPQQLEEIRVGALLHDIGKIGIGDVVLQKPGKLTIEEFALIKQHPTIGLRILEGVRGFHSYLPVVELHHENWDGTGYPRGLAQEAVPLFARIVHVVDAYDAMTSDRPYRAGMSHDQTVKILEKFAGSQFDPVVVRVFVALQIQKPEALESEPALECLEEMPV